MLTDNHIHEDSRVPKRKWFWKEGIENEDNRHLTARDKLRVDTYILVFDSLIAEHANLCRVRKSKPTQLLLKVSIFLPIKLPLLWQVRHLESNFWKVSSLDFEEDFCDLLVRFSGYLNQMDAHDFTPIKLLRHILE